MIQFMLRLVVCVALTTALGTAVAKERAIVFPFVATQGSR